jgi:hypothetical protein
MYHAVITWWGNIRWGIRTLKNSGIGFKPILKRNGFFVSEFRLASHASRFTVKKVRVNEVSEGKSK